MAEYNMMANGHDFSRAPAEHVLIRIALKTTATGKVTVSDSSFYFTNETDKARVIVMAGAMRQELQKERGGDAPARG